MIVANKHNPLVVLPATPVTITTIDGDRIHGTLWLDWVIVSDTTYIDGFTVNGNNVTFHRNGPRIARPDRNK